MGMVVDDYFDMVECEVVVVGLVDCGGGGYDVVGE